MEIQELRQQLQTMQKTLATFSRESNIEHVILSPHTAAVVALALHNNFIFSGSMDGMLKLTDISTLQLVREVSLGPVFQLKIANSRMYSGHTDCIRVWDMVTYTLVAELPGHIGHVKSIIVQANRLISGAKVSSLPIKKQNKKTTIHSTQTQGEIKVWDTGSLRCLHTVPNAHKGDIRDFAAVTDSGGMMLYLFSCGEDGNIRSWNRNFICERVVKAHRAPIRAMLTASIQGFGELLITGSEDTFIKIWDVGLVDPATALLARIPCLVGVTALAFVPPCQLISGHTDGSIRVWSIQTPQAIRCERLLSGHEESVRALVVGQNFFLSGGYDNKIIAWYPTGGAPHS